MLTDGTEQREFLYAEDCCEALEAVMENYEEIGPDDNLHITSFQQTTILEIAEIIQFLFSKLGHDVKISPANSKDEVQKDKRNEAIHILTDSGRQKLPFRMVLLMCSMT